MKIVLAPDSFKGSLSAHDAAQAMARGIRRVWPEATIILLPLADGGEGTVDALVTATSGQKIAAQVTGPLGTPVPAFYGFLGDSMTAVVEMAAASGLTLVPEPQRDPRHTTTYGTGELIQAAIDAGAQKLIVGLGGSATNDGGAGAMQALGVRFLDAQGSSLPVPIGGADLIHLAKIDRSEMRFPVGQVPVIIASDVTNPLLGPQGAAAIFGPQKGATPEMVTQLDASLSNYADILHKEIGRNVADLPGAGAAGGLGAALMAFLNASMQSGIDLLLNTVGFETQVRDADWVLTGEGRIDHQTLQGKAVMGILRRSRSLGVPVIAFGGAVDEEAASKLYAQSLRTAVPIVNRPMTTQEAMSQAADLLEKATERTARLWM